MPTSMWYQTTPFDLILPNLILSNLIPRIRFWFGGTFSNVICHLMQSKGLKTDFPCVAREIKPLNYWVFRSHQSCSGLVSFSQTHSIHLGKSGWCSLASNSTKHYGTLVTHCSNCSFSFEDTPFGLASVHRWIHSTENWTGLLCPQFWHHSNDQLLPL